MNIFRVSRIMLKAKLNLSKEERIQPKKELATSGSLCHAENNWYQMKKTSNLCRSVEGSSN